MESEKFTDERKSGCKDGWVNDRISTWLAIRECMDGQMDEQVDEEEKARRTSRPSIQREKVYTGTNNHGREWAGAYMSE